MGLRADIYRWHRNGDFSNGGLSSRVDEVTLVNVEGPFEPTEDAPAAMLVHGNLPGTAKIVAATEVAPGGDYVADEGVGLVGPMMGGCYVATSDSRFARAVEKLLGHRFYGAVPLHDRFETQAQYDALSR